MKPEHDQTKTRRDHSTPADKTWTSPRLTKHEAAAAENNFGGVQTDGLYTS